MARQNSAFRTELFNYDQSNVVESFANKKSLLIMSVWPSQIRAIARALPGNSIQLAQKKGGENTLVLADSKMWDVTDYLAGNGKKLMRKNY